MSRAYVTTDGSFGDADFLYVFDDSKWTQEDWDEFDMTSDNERWDKAHEINIRKEQALYR